jgi:glycosyltransferase involved in cell wall biosynthesis
MFRRHAPEHRPAVCIVRHNYYPDSHVRRDAEALAAAGYDVTVISLRRAGQAARERLNGVDVRRLPVEHRRGSVARYAWEYSSFLVLAFLTITLLHFRKRLRVVEVDSMPDILVFSALVPKLSGVPVILYIFDNMPELLAYLWKTNERHPLVRLLAFQERISTRFADHVVVTQELPRQLALKRGVPEDKLSVVVNCADNAIWSRDLIPASVEKDPRFTIVTHGTILERYGIQTLIDAMPSVLQQIPDARVLVFGQGEFRVDLERQVERLGLQAHVDFRGFVSLDELRESVAHADVGYVGMLNDLVLPNKLMEYVAMGVPAVMSRWWTFVHYYPEDSAFYFQTGDAGDLARAILSVHADPVGAKLRAARASERYQAYQWSVQKQVYLGVYARLMSRTSPNLVTSEPSELAAAVEAD